MGTDKTISEIRETRGQETASLRDGEFHDSRSIDAFTASGWNRNADALDLSVISVSRWRNPLGIHIGALNSPLPMRQRHQPRA
jgi:hypothetical protein